MGDRGQNALRGGLPLLMAAVVVSGLSWSAEAAAAEPSPPSAGRLAALLPDDVLADLSGSESRSVAAALATPGAAASLPVAVMSRDDGNIVVTRLAAQPARAAELAAVLEQQPSVDAADVDTTVRAIGTVDPYAGLQWPLARLESSSVWAAVAAATDPANALPVVAVIDTGLQADHPDLVGLSVAGFDFVTAAPTAAGASTDPHGHGTHVSGIIGATVSNGVGVAGLLPGARIMPVRVLDAAGSGNSSAVAEGMVWAVDHGARVLSLSLGGGASTLMQAAADYAEAHGVLVVAAAGNDGNGSNAVSYPCAYDTVLCVGATTQSDAIATFSTHGAQVDIAAPGESVLSTYHGSGYVYMSGTSMATPYVAAAAAFAWSGHPGYSAAQLRDRLVATADDLGTPGRDEFFGAGLVDPVAAYSSSGTPPPGTPASFDATLDGTSVSFVWGSAVRASAFAIRASVDGGAVSDVVRTSAMTASVAVQPGSTYVFTLVATNEGGSSPPLTQQIAVRPASPLLAGAGAGTLAWAPVAGATSYAVWRDGETTPLTTTADVTYAPSVAPGTSHAFRVTATGPSGVSDPSNAVTVSAAAVPVVLVVPVVPVLPVVPAVPVVPVLSEPDARTDFAAPVLAAPRLDLTGPDRLIFGTSAAVSARAGNGERVSLTVSGPCSLTGTLLRAKSGVGRCTVTATTAASSTWARATAKLVVATVRARDTVSSVRAGRLTRTSDLTLRLHARSGSRVAVVTSGPCSLRKGVLHAKATTGTCRLRARTSGSRNWEPVELVQIFSIGAQGATTSRR